MYRSFPLFRVAEITSPKSRSGWSRSEGRSAIKRSEHLSLSYPPSREIFGEEPKKTVEWEVLLPMAIVLAPLVILLSLLAIFVVVGVIWWLVDFIRLNYFSS